MTDELIENTGEPPLEEPTPLTGQLELVAQITRDFRNMSSLLDYCKMLGIEGGSFNKVYNSRGQQVYRLVYNRIDI